MYQPGADGLSVCRKSYAHTAPYLCAIHSVDMYSAGYGEMGY